MPERLGAGGWGLNGCSGIARRFRGRGDEPSGGILGHEKEVKVLPKAFFLSLPFFLLNSKFLFLLSIHSYERKRKFFLLLNFFHLRKTSFH